MADTRTNRRRVTGLAWIFLIAAAAVLGVGVYAAVSHGSKPPTRPGSAVVYDRIAKLTDCGQLHHELDVASANHTRDLAAGNNSLAEIDFSYMTAAYDRLNAIDCS